MKKYKLSAFLGYTLCLSLLTGCASNPTQTNSKTEAITEEITVDLVSENTITDNTITNNTTYPIIITHAFGETIINEKPKNIVAIGWENQDTPLALGIIPVGVSAANYGFVTDDKLHPWTSAAFQSLGENNPVVFDDVDGLDYEAISDTNPDIILSAYSGLTEEEYLLLTEIAPVIPYAEKPWQTFWRDQTIQNATGMGMKEEGEALVANMDHFISEKLANYPELSGTKTAFFWISPEDFSNFYVYLPSDPRAAYLTDLGLAIPESVLTLGKDSSDFSITISRENADQLNDVEMMVVYGDQNLLTALQADPLMSQIPAIKNGAVVLVDNNSELAGACTPSILSIPAVIDDYLELLSTAHGNIR